MHAVDPPLYASRSVHCVNAGSVSMAIVCDWKFHVAVQVSGHNATAWGTWVAWVSEPHRKDKEGVFFWSTLSLGRRAKMAYCGLTSVPWGQVVPAGKFREHGLKLTSVIRVRWWCRARQGGAGRRRPFTQTRVTFFVLWGPSIEFSCILACILACEKSER